MTPAEHNAYPQGRWSKPTLQEVTKEMEAKDVAAALDSHVDICTERWGTMRDTLKEVKASIESLRGLVVTAGGVLIVGMGGVIVTLVLKLGGVK